MAATKKDIYSEGSLLKKKKTKKNIDRRLIDFKFTFVFFLWHFVMLLINKNEKFKNKNFYYLCGYYLLKHYRYKNSKRKKIFKKAQKT